MKLSLNLITLVFTFGLLGCGGTGNTDAVDDDALFKQGPSRGARYFTADYEPSARVALDGLWVMEDQFGDIVDALEIHEQEEVLIYARRCRFASGRSLFTYVEVDVDLKANYMEVQEDATYTALPDGGNGRLNCRMSLNEELRIYFRVVDKQMLVSTTPSMRNPVQFYKVRDNR